MSSIDSKNRLNVEWIKYKFFLIIIVLMCLPSNLYAQSVTDTITRNPGLKLDLPLFDYPYQKYAGDAVGKGFFGSYANPGMSQSLAVTTDLFSGVHYGIKHFLDKSKLSDDGKLGMNVLCTGIIDFLLLYAPGGDGWMHEEYHRAVLSRHGVNSFNGMNLFPIGKELVSVNKIKDEDLVRLKRESPADFVRYTAAGIEGEYMLINRLQRNNFFYNQKLSHEFLYWLVTVNSIGYIFTSSMSGEVDKKTAEMNEKEQTIASRDGIGFDMTTWAYDIFRPDEPYEARGVHPSGTGINRYRTTQDLLPHELKYLRRQGVMSLVNLLSPMMFGYRSIPIGENGVYGNFAMRHLLTSFGRVVSTQVFLKKEPFNMAFAFHNYRNYKNFFPAVEADLVDYPVQWGKFGMYVSPHILLGAQPKDQNFRTNKADFLGLLGLRVDIMSGRHIFPYVDFTAKTKGWVAGNEFLNSNTSVKIGISARF
jgi:hypothetical protein